MTSTLLPSTKAEATLTRSFFGTGPYRASVLPQRVTRMDFPRIFACKEFVDRDDSRRVDQEEGSASAGSSPGLLSGLYFLTPHIMNDVHVSTECANMAVRALYSYKRTIGHGSDLMGELPDAALMVQIDAAIHEFFSKAKGKTNRPEAKKSID